MKAYRARREGETEDWLVLHGVTDHGTHQIVLTETDARRVRDKLTEILTGTDTHEFEPGHCFGCGAEQGSDQADEPCTA